MHLIGLLLAITNAHAKPVTRTELSTTFTAHQYDHSDVPLSLTKGANVKGAAAVVTPFSEAPYDEYTALGGQITLSQSINGVRFGVGWQRPYPTFNLTDGFGKHVVSGEESEVSARSIKINSWRFHVGLEYPNEFIIPYVDLVGTRHHITTDLAINGQPVSYDGSVFGFSGRAGLSVAVAEGFAITVAAEKGLIGHSDYGASLGIAGFFGTNLDHQRHKRNRSRLLEE